MSFRSLRCSFAAAMLAAFAFCGAQQQYAQKTTNVNVGVLLFDSYQVSGVLANPTPFVWYNLDSNKSVKPPEWNLVNPAHTSLTQAVVNRWTTLDPSTPGVGVSTLQKQDAPYWEVPLTQTSDAQLMQFDVLLAPLHGFFQLNTNEREKLIHFIDKGGVLWLDTNDTTQQPDPINNAPLPFELNNVGSPTLANPQADYIQPLFNFPSIITETDLSAMQSTSTVQRFRPVQAGDVSSTNNIEQTILGETLNLIPIAGDNDGASIAIGQIGDGYMVVTTRGVASALNSVPGDLANDKFLADKPAFNTSSDSAAKFVINMASLVTGHRATGRGSHMTNASPVPIGAPLLEAFHDPSLSLLPSRPKDYKPPVIYKGLAIASDDSKIYVYNARPGTDISGSGNPDQGIVDFSNGTSYDLIWSSSASPNHISPPIAIEVPQASGGYRDQILVTDTQGNVLVWQAFRGTDPDPANVAPDKSIAPPEDVGGTASVGETEDGPGPYAPTYHEGIVFVTDSVSTGAGPNDGRVWVIDPSTQTPFKGGAGSDWFTGGASNGVLTEVTGPATVGYIPVQDNSGAVDRVVYVPSRGNSNNPGPGGTAGITSLWLGVRGERPSSVSASGGVLTIATRASSQGLNVFVPSSSDPPSVQALGVKLTILDTNGNPLDQAATSALIDNTAPQAANVGVLTYNLLGAWNDNFGVRLDYTIDWGQGNASTTSQIVRGQLYLPDDSAKARRILPNLALAPDGTLYFVTSTQDAYTSADVSGGSYFAVREEGRGAFNVLTRWDLYNQHTITLNDANDVLYPPSPAANPSWTPGTLANNDPLTGILPFLSGPMINLTFVSGPSVRNGIVYVLAEATNTAKNIPSTVLLAFNASPPAPEIRATDLSSGFTILQPDIMRSSSKAAPEVFSVLQPNQYTLESPNAGAGGYLRLSSLCSTNRGPMLNCLSTSQPLIIRRNGQPDQLYDPESNGSRWNPLLWYTVFTGSGTDSGHIGMGGPPLVAGDTVYVPITSYLPSLISGSATTPEGLIFALNGNVSPNDPYLASDPDRGWLKQLYQVSGTTTSNVAANPDILWPQLTFPTDTNVSISDIRIRILQATLTGSSVALGSVAGDGGLYAWADNGIFGFNRADFIVADSGRLARFDSSGEPIWSLDATLATGMKTDTGPAGTIHQLVNPTRAYSVSDRNLLIVDPGANRIVEADVSGREKRSLGDFRVDIAGTHTAGASTPAYLPDGYVANESLNLLGPRDALTYSQRVLAANNPFDSPQPEEYWVHYLVADTGNHRLLDLVDRYQVNTTTGQIGDVVTTEDGVKAFGMLYWHSPATVSTKSYAYTTVARQFIGGSPVVVAGIGNMLPTDKDLGNTASLSTLRQSQEGNGGIVIFGTGQPVVINQVKVPAIAADVYYDSTSGTFDLPAAPTVAGFKPIGSVNSVTVKSVNNGNLLTVMYTDVSGVYEIFQNGAEWDVDWMLPREAYRALRRTPANVPTGQNPSDLLPTFAKRLDSSEVLVVNGANGTFFGNPNQNFTGEIVLLNGDTTQTQPDTFNPSALNLGFSSLSIRLVLPPIIGTRGLVNPIFADRR